MRSLPFISALIGMAFGHTPQLLPGDRRRYAGRSFKRRNKVSRQARGQQWMQWLYAKQAASRLARYGLDVTGDPAVVANERRLMRNARKAERRQARRPGKFWLLVRKYLAHKYDERNLP